MLDKKLYDPNAANYLISLSLIVRNLKILNSDQIAFIRRLSIYCFNDFISVQLKSEWKNNISNAIIISIYCLASSSHENILDKYLKQLCKDIFYVYIICDVKSSIYIIILNIMNYLCSLYGINKIMLTSRCY